MKIKLFFKSSLLICGIVALQLLSSYSKGNDSNSDELWSSSGERNKIVVISDLHLGIDDHYSEFVANRPDLVGFLKQIQHTKDVRELVIAGDFLDEWYLPYSYTGKITDEDQFYRGVIKNNQSVIDELNNVVKSGVKLVYVQGNHDMTLKNNILAEAIPGVIKITGDAQGLGTYYTGDRNEIAIEHSHRYDVFSAPDPITNKELCGNDNTILPVGYFYAINAASWVIQGKPNNPRNLPKVDEPGEYATDDCKLAYLYYKRLGSEMAHHTPNEDINEPTFKMHFAGFNDDYSFLDLFPQQHSDGIYAKLYKNIQRTWGNRQAHNNVRIPSSFSEAILGILSNKYYAKQALIQHLNRTDKNIDVVVFGHTHIPYYVCNKNKFYVNSGTWVDANSSDNNNYARTFVVVTTGTTNKVDIFTYNKDGSIKSILNDVIARQK